MSSFIWRSSARRKLFNQFGPVKKVDVPAILMNGGNKINVPSVRLSGRQIFAIVLVVILVATVLMMILL